MTVFQKSCSFCIVCALGLAVTLSFSGCKSSNVGDSNRITDSTAAISISQELPPGTILSESLKDGQTSGYYENATLTADGLQFIGGEAFLRYGIPTTPNGYIEFSAKGFVQDELHGGSEFKSMLFSMWSGDEAYEYESASHLYELRKFGAIIGHPASNAFDLRFIVDRDWNHGVRRVVGWDPSVNYRFRVEWGYGSTSVYRDGDLMINASYRGTFQPSNHQIQIGANLLSHIAGRKKEAPHDILVSDVIVGNF